MGALAEALGLYGDPDEWSVIDAPDRLEALSEGVRLFLRCGGSISIQDFGSLSHTERAVFAAVYSDNLPADDPPPVDCKSALVSFMERARE